MYNPFPPSAGGTVGTLAITGAATGMNSIALSIVAIVAIIGGLLALRTAKMRNPEVPALGSME
ncbi:hypothetical protein [Microbacterium sp. A84]|uniref:hypothetical protein n=1 Tax=Microbacterium sp. A84 TaxID=3450715 RepID=UPI003F427D13